METPIAAEHFIAAQAGERNLHARSAGSLRDEVRIHAVDGGLVHGAHRFGDGVQGILAGNCKLMMISFEKARHGARVLAFRVVRLTKDDGERAGTHAAAAQDGDQAARIDSSREKNPYRHITDQLHAHGFIEQVVHAAFLLGMISRRAAALSRSTRFAGQAPIPARRYRSLLPRQRVARR